MSRTRSAPRRNRTLSEETAPRFHRNDIFYIFILAAVITISYIPLFSNSFIDYDDPVYITHNLHIARGLTLESFIWAWSATEAGNWHPLTWISHAVDVDLFGLEPAGHHFTSLLIHVLNAMLIYLLLSQITQRKELCFVAAALFGLHPLSVESVSWAAERKNVLCTLFFLLSIGVYGWYTRKPNVARYCLLMLTFALALSAKPMVITLPFVLALLDFWPLGRVQSLSRPNNAFPVQQLQLSKLLTEKVPLLVMSAGSAVITLIAQSSAGAIASTSSISLATRVANAVYSYFAYMVHLVWPVHLVPFYPQMPLSRWQIGVAFLCVVFLSALVWRQRSSRPYLAVAWMIYLGTLVPVIGLVQVGKQAMADRYTYIPMIGVFAAITWFADELATTHKMPRVLRMLVPVAILSGLAILTWIQVARWRDDVTLWSYNLQVTPVNSVVEDNLGLALLQQGRVEEALPHFYNAERIDPGDPISAVNVATDLLSHGRAQEAIAKYESALTNAGLIPMLLPNVHSNLGSAFLSVGNIEKAREHYKLALSLNSDDQVARSGLQRIENPGLEQPAVSK